MYVIVVFTLLFSANVFAAIDIKKVEWENNILKDIRFSSDLAVESITINFISNNEIVSSLITTDFIMLDTNNYSLNISREINGKNIKYCEFLLKNKIGEEVVDVNKLIECGLSDKSYSDVVYFFSSNNSVSEVIYGEATTIDAARDVVAENFFPGLQLFNYLFFGKIPVKVCALDSFCLDEVPVILILCAIFISTFLLIRVVKKKKEVLIRGEIR